jgi:hypothetical protein
MVAVAVVVAVVVVVVAARFELLVAAAGLLLMAEVRCLCPRGRRQGRVGRMEDVVIFY